MIETSMRPDVRQFLDLLKALKLPMLYEAGVEEARKMMIAGRYEFDAPAREIALIRDVNGPVPMRLYDARNERGPGPVLLFVHGGGWVVGNLECYDPLCIDLAIELDLPVVAIDYRLAPEHPFPASVEDSIAAARWVASAAKELGRVPTGLFLAGDSSGGNLAAVVSAALRDQPAPVAIFGQWLIYPVADPGISHPSYEQFGEGYLLTKETLAWYERCYAARADDWRYSPLLAGTAGLPPTLVLAAGLDPLRDQARTYAARCTETGVETIYLEASGTIHGFLSLRKAMPSGEKDLANCLTYLSTWIERSR